MRSSNTSPSPQLEALLAVLKLLVLTICFLPSASAIDPNRLMSQYVRDRWGAEHGFPRGPVYAIAQTPDGYLWFGVDSGLIRFDGINFVPIKDASGTFDIHRVLGLEADNEGSLWVRMEGWNLLRYRNGAFDQPTRHLPRPDTFVWAISKSNRGEFLFARNGPATFTYRGGKFELLASSDDLPRTPILSIAQSGGGEIWIGTRDAGLFRLRNGHAYAVNQELPDSKVDSLLPDGKETLLVGTDNGVVRWNGTRLTPIGIPKSFNPFQALALLKDRDANVWIGTDSRGLLRLNNQGVSVLHDGAFDNAVTALFEDREGSIWIGSANGIERLRDSAFVSYSPAEGIPSDGAIPVFVDSTHRTWFPPVNGGLWWIKDGMRGKVTEAGLDQDVVYSIGGGNNELWIGRRHGGLTHLRFRGASSFSATTYTRANGLAQDSVFAVEQSRDGALWAGTLSGGVSRFQGGKFETFTEESGLASNTIFCIVEGANGTMWFATPGGLSAWTNHHFRSYTTKDGLPSNDINSLLEDSQGTLWIGTSSGLAHLGPHGFGAPGAAPEALHEQIFGMAEDRRGFIWLSTSNHVLRVNRDALVLNKFNQGDLTSYGLADGLRGLEGVKRHRSVIADSLGRIWFSMNLGISVVDPNRIASFSAPAIVQVQSIAADGAAMNLRGAVRIPSQRRRVTIDYAGLNLAVPERVRFRYTLEGFDRGWSEPIAARQAVYTNLGPGAYRFRVIATNPDGIWNSKEADLPFEIEPAFWQTSLFRIASVLASLLLIFAAYRLRLQQLTGQLSLRFEERLAERTRIAQELHDTLLQGFISASMQLHLAVDDLPQASSARPRFASILRLVAGVIEEGRHAVRGLRLTRNPAIDLEQAFSRIHQEFNARPHTGFRVIVDGSAKPLHPVIRDEVYWIGREALVNAFRHSHAQNIEVELEYGTKRLRVFVRDDGCGIDAKVVQTGREGHWGLQGMRERAARIGGQVSVWSSPSSGTEIQLSVPGHFAFQTPPRGPLRRLFTSLATHRTFAPNTETQEDQ